MTGYRTYLAAALVAVFGVLASTDWIAFLDDPKAGAVAVGAAMLMAAMRSVTATPPGRLDAALRALGRGSARG
jgi:hypothetical protein